jgi:hypothetical protein
LERILKAPLAQICGKNRRARSAAQNTGLLNNERLIFLKAIGGAIRAGHRTLENDRVTAATDFVVGRALYDFVGLASPIFDRFVVEHASECLNFVVDG